MANAIMAIYGKNDWRTAAGYYFIIITNKINHHVASNYFDVWVWAFNHVSDESIRYALQQRVITGNIDEIFRGPW